MQVELMIYTHPESLGKHPRSALLLAHPSSI